MGIQCQSKGDPLYSPSLCDLIKFLNTRVYPLSLLSFAAACRIFESPCTPPGRSGDPIVTPQVEDDPMVTPRVGDDPIVTPRVEDGPIMTPQVEGLSHWFRRHVKPKKQHEIVQLGKVESNGHH